MNDILKAALQEIIEYEVDDMEYTIGRNAGGSVYYNSGRQVWQAAFYLEENGIKKRKIISGIDEDDARNRMQILQGVTTPLIPVVTTEPVIITPVVQGTKPVLVKDYLGEIMKREITKGVAYTTAQSYGYDAKYIYRNLGDRYICDLSRSEIQACFDTLTLKNGNTASDAVKDRVYSILSKMMAMAALEGIIQVNPMSVRIKIDKSAKTNKSLESWYDFELIRQILKAVKGHKIYDPLIVTLLGTGTRIGEVIALSWDRIDFDKQTILVDRSLKRFKVATNNSGETVLVEIGIDDNTTGVKGKIIEKVEDYKVGGTKTGISRVIPVGEHVMKVLRDLKDRSNPDVGWVFPNQMGKLRSYDGLRCQIAKHWRKHGLGTEHILFHRLRHTTATYLRAAGVAEDVVAAILGHKREGMTAAGYMDIIGSLRSEAMEKYELFLKEKLEGAW